MMSKEELKQLKDDVAEIQEKLRKLTDEELEQVFGGNDYLGEAVIQSFSNITSAVFIPGIATMNCPIIKITD